MNQHPKDKDKDVRQRPSHMDQARGSDSVMDDKESFEHGSGTSDVARGMGRVPERGRSQSEE